MAVMQILFSLLLRLGLLAAGLVFAAALFAGICCIAALWGMRYAWAKVTGRPIIPLAVRIDPLGGFGRVYRSGQGGTPSRQAQALRPARRDIGEVTDVIPKEPRA